MSSGGTRPLPCWWWQHSPASWPGWADRELWHRPAPGVKLVQAHGQGALPLVPETPGCVQPRHFPAAFRMPVRMPLLLTLSSCLAKASGCVRYIQGMPLGHLVLVAKGAGIPGLHRNVMVGKTVLGWSPPPGCCIGSELKHNPSLMKKDYLVSGAAA